MVGRMNRTAYLVAHVDTTSRPPTVVGVGIYSEGSQTLSGAISNRSWAFDVLHATGEDFETAIANAKAAVDQFPNVYGWVKRFELPEFTGGW